LKPKTATDVYMACFYAFTLDSVGGGIMFWSCLSASFVCLSRRSCYHDISWTAWALYILDETYREYSL